MSYSEAFMGTGRKQTDVEKLVDDLELARDCAVYIRGLLAEASDVILGEIILREQIRNGDPTVEDYKIYEPTDKRSQDFLTRIAPLVKQHRGE